MKKLPASVLYIFLILLPIFLLFFAALFLLQYEDEK